MVVLRWFGVALMIVLAWDERAAYAQPAGCSLPACADADGDGFVRCDCAPAGLACDCDDANANVYPGAPEACDSPTDISCNGVVGDRCAPRTGCHESVCVGECVPLDDFGCPPDTHCEQKSTGERLCIPKDCSIYGCPPGSTCDDAKTCVPTCTAEVKCPFGQRCRGTGCIDPCANVACPEGTACASGRCEPACTCPGVTCTGALGACDATSGRCVDAACANIACAPGTHCENGTCVDDCANVVCPTKRVCRVRAGRGECVDLCNPDPCTSAYECQWRTGECTPRPIADGGFTNPDERGDLAGAGFRLAGGGCACEHAGFPRGSAFGAFAFVAMIVLSALRRR
jgi:hypothetical protein